MKKSTKLGIGGLVLLLGAVALTGCTQSFCSTNDKAHIMYMYDYGVSEYYNEAGTAEDDRVSVRGFTNLYAQAVRPTDSASILYKADQAAKSANLTLPSDRYLIELDTTVLQHATANYFGKTSFANVTNDELAKVVSRDDSNKNNQEYVFVQDILDKYGYLKYADSETEKNKLWVNFDNYVNETRLLVSGTSPVLTLDDLASNDYFNLYKTQMNNAITAYRSCIAISTDDYGYYGYGSNRGKVEIEGKSWGYAWKKGPFEGLLVYPIAWFVDTMCNVFQGVGAGWAQLLAILVVTFVVRALMLLVTIKSTAANAKMTALQPQIQKIQAKYPNANTNQYEKQRMAEEMQKLYKANKINPLSSLVQLIVQFPVFICVWGGLQGAASLSSDAVLGLNLSMTIKEVLFNKVYWTAAGNFGAITALVLFLLMAATQVISMLIPQIAQKRAAKQAVKLGKNPAKKEQDNKMKWFTYIMMGVIIIMGFSLASAMGVYWLVGGLFSIVQTLITQKVTAKKKQQKRY